VGLKSLKSLNLTNGYPNKNKKNKNNNNNNKVKSKPLELFELAGKNENDPTTRCRATQGDEVTCSVARYEVA
jgi:hypothetical protein